MTEGRSRGIEKAGIGCLVAVAVVAVLLGGRWLAMMQLASRGVETRETLDAAFPAQDAFTPDGAVAPDRMERFLAVRRALMSTCEEFTGYRAAFQRMEEMDSAQEEPAAGEAMSRVGAVFSALPKMGRAAGEYAISRNRALMENAMGLGEYTWIYVIAYYAWLGNRPVSFPGGDGDETKVFHGRVRNAVKNMMARHLADLRAAADTAHGASALRLEEAVAAWSAEMDSLNADTERIPFQGGLPRTLASSLQPFRDDLERLYCPATGELEIMQTVKTGVWYDHR